MNEVVEHAVVVDSGARLIIDPCYNTHLRLQWNVFLSCVGNSSYEKTLYILSLIHI